MTCKCTSDASRRRFLAGLLGTGATMLLPAGARAGRLAEGGPGITVDGQPVTAGEPLQPGARIVTPRGTEAAIVVDGAAAMIGGGSGVELLGDRVIDVFKVVTGSLLAVFSPDAGRERRVQTTLATMGIRGTGVFVEARGYDESYICTCFGEVDLDTRDGMRERVRASHHAARRVLVEQGETRIAMASQMGHTDAQVRGVARRIGVRAFPKLGG